MENYFQGWYAYGTEDEVYASVEINARNGMFVAQCEVSASGKTDKVKADYPEAVDEMLADIGCDPREVEWKLDSGRILNGPFAEIMREEFEYSDDYRVRPRQHMDTTQELQEVARLVGLRKVRVDARSKSGMTAHLYNAFIGVDSQIMQFAVDGNDNIVVTLSAVRSTVLYEGSCDIILKDGTEIEVTW